MMLSDNISRKKTLVLSYILVTIGLLLLSLSINIYMVCISLFITGLGSNISLRIIQAILSEQIEKKLAERIISTNVLPYTLALMFVGQIFAITSNWRTFTLYFCFIPSFLITSFIVYFVEDSPKYLLWLEEEKAI